MSIETAIKQSKFSNPYHKLIVNITYTSNWLMHRQIEILRPFDLSPQQYNVLRILKGSYPAPLKVQDISERMLDQTSNTSRLIDKLNSKKLIDKRTSREDRRAADVAINRAGLELLHITTPLIISLENSLHHVDADAVENFSRILDDLRGE